jgi:hypothetical protein
MGFAEPIDCPTIVLLGDSLALLSVGHVIDNCYKVAQAGMDFNSITRESFLASDGFLAAYRVIRARGEIVFTYNSTEDWILPQRSIIYRYKLLLTHVYSQFRGGSRTNL